MCFNGAAAVQPRNGDWLWLGSEEVVKLQWGRGCSAAEWLPVIVEPVASDKLQWGRGCSAAECATRAVFHLSHTIASMGPRLFSRGMVSSRVYIRNG